MKKILFILMLAVSTTCGAQIKLGYDYHAAQLNSGDMNVKQIYYNDTFLFVTYDVRPSMEDSLIAHVFPGQEFFSLDNDMYYSISQDHLTFTLFAKSSWTKLILRSTINDCRYMYNKIWWLVPQIRQAGGEINLLASN